MHRKCKSAGGRKSILGIFLIAADRELVVKLPRFSAITGVPLQSTRNEENTGYKVTVVVQMASRVVSTGNRERRPRKTEIKKKDVVVPSKW